MLTVIYNRFLRWPSQTEAIWNPTVVPDPSVKGAQTVGFSFIYIWLHYSLMPDGAYFPAGLHWFWWIFQWDLQQRDQTVDFSLYIFGTTIPWCPMALNFRPNSVDLGDYSSLTFNSVLKQWLSVFYIYIPVIKLQFESKKKACLFFLQ